MFPNGQEWKFLMINGRSVYLRYGGRATRRLSQEHSPHVIMQPDTGFLMKHKLSILHVGKSWTRGSYWPFIAKSSQAEAVVIPFEFGEDQRLPDLVIIVSYGYLTTDNLQKWQDLLDIHDGHHGLQCMLVFKNSLTFGSRG